VKKGEKRASWIFIEKQLFLAGSFMNEQLLGFSIKWGSGFAWPSHHFYGGGGIWEGSPDVLQHLTRSSKGVGENFFIGRVKANDWVRLIWL